MHAHVRHEGLTRCVRWLANRIPSQRFCRHKRVKQEAAAAWRRDNDDDDKADVWNCFARTTVALAFHFQFPTSLSVSVSIKTASPRGFSSPLLLSPSPLLLFNFNQHRQDVNPQQPLIWLAGSVI
jgi:hypothetical protein